MKQKAPLNVTLDLDWRVLLLLLVVASVLVFAYGTSGATGDPPNTNDAAAQPAASGANPPAAGSAADTPNLPVRPAGAASDALPTTNGAWISPTGVGSVPTRVDANAVAATSGQHFYLTELNYATDGALTACIAGYHMASLWEILDVSNLIYDYSLPAAHKQADDGYGPPSGWNGWVRTGAGSSGSATTGQGNCLSWTSTASANNGVAVQLSNSWETAPGEISVWNATTFSCNLVGPIWCIKD